MVRVASAFLRRPDALHLSPHGSREALIRVVVGRGGEWRALEGGCARDLAGERRHVSLLPHSNRGPVAGAVHMCVRDRRCGSTTYHSQQGDLQGWGAKIQKVCSRVRARATPSLHLPSFPSLPGRADFQPATPTAGAHAAMGVRRRDPPSRRCYCCLPEIACVSDVMRTCERVSTRRTREVDGGDDGGERGWASGATAPPSRPLLSSPMSSAPHRGRVALGGCVPSRILNLPVKLAAYTGRVLAPGIECNPKCRRSPIAGWSK